MKPETVAKLLDNIPEVKELIAFLASEAEKLNALDAVDDDRDFEGIAIELIARKRAKQTIDAILAPLLGAVDKPIGADPSEFVV